MVRKYIPFSIVLAIAGITSCTEQVKPTPYVYTQVFTGASSKTWKVSFLEQTLKGAVSATFSVSCASDDQYTLHNNVERTSEANTGSKKCSSTELNLYSDAWSYNSSTATLTMILPFLTDSSLPLIVREATKTKMVLEIFFDATNTESYRIHFESTHEE